MPLGEILTAVGIMVCLGFGLSVVLAFANKKLYVYEDPRIDVVDDMLPHANCGACGCAGCRNFAEKAVERTIAPGKCTVNSAEMTEKIARFLGVDAGREEKRVARLACAGGANVARVRGIYTGMQTCRASHLIAGGGKGCAWGCLGLGDCKDVCDFGAIVMDRHGLPVVDESKCTACGACVAICPRALFSLQPVSRRLWVACKSLAKGEEAERECDVACTGCGLCAVDAAPGLVVIKQNLAVVDYSKNTLASEDAIQRCPTGAIVWIDGKRGFVKGASAKRITRKSTLPPIPVG